MKLFPRASGFAALSITLVTLCNGLPASAQVWGYSPWTGAANWLSVARGLSYPLNRLSGSAYAPFYLGNQLIYAGSYAVNQRLMNKSRQADLGSYSDQEPYYDPRQRTRPNFAGGYGTQDQVVHATWKKQAQELAQQQQDDDDVPVPQQSNQNDWLTQPIEPGQGSSPPMGLANNGAPNVVAPTVSEKMPPVAPTLPPRQGQPRTSEPLALGFVQVVNERFNGDVGEALRDKDLRKYARSVGLVDSDKAPADNMTREKSDLIRAIFADQNETASTKINAVRVLLKH